jgi:hypothetical protein
MLIITITMWKPRNAFSWGETVSLATGAVCPHQLIVTNRRPFILPVKVTTSWKNKFPLPIVLQSFVYIARHGLHPMSSCHLWIRRVQQPLLSMIIPDWHTFEGTV